MSTAKEIFAQESNKLRRLGLQVTPFNESPSKDSEILSRVFTGREDELRQVARLFLGQQRQRILVYGRIGIGKSAFLLEVLAAVEEFRPDMLTVYATLEEGQSLAQAALIELAQSMPHSNLAKRQLHAMGIAPREPLRKRKSSAGAKAVFSAETSEEEIPLTKLENFTANLNVLLDEAREQHPDGVLIAIDDLDKQDPQHVRELMHNAQGMLKGSAWYLLTGHPTGITGDLLTTERGLFDLRLELNELDPDTRYQMLVNYLDSVRINPKDSRSVLPFTEEAARRFCDESRGIPRRFNRLGAAVLNEAIALEDVEESITLPILDRCLRAALSDFRKQAALTVQTERVFDLVTRKGGFSSENISLEDLQSIGFSRFGEIVPHLERLRDADLIDWNDRGDTTEYEPLLLTSSSQGPPLLEGDSDERPTP